MGKKLVAQNVCKSFGKLEVLKNINLEIFAGEIVVLLGESGAGKSTLLKILATFESFDQGEIFIDNQNIAQLAGDRLAHFRNRHIGFVFQENNLLPELTALENVCLPRFIHNGDKKIAIDDAKKILSDLGLEKRFAHKPSELSGGEQQRVAVARALINNPAIIFADEPSGSLDSKNASNLHEMFLLLKNIFNQTFIIATHNTNLARLSHRQIMIQDGKLFSQ
ncbi:MAG: ABC transporter ATP-binding protein [Cytophagales bacterium]|jgi:lipoprotein-releasing system ATP-binding protein|nr:ABC transporter ATP-binding protein [Cytophagales bacterium]